jgi:hypothetical protein
MPKQYECTDILKANQVFLCNKITGKMLEDASKIVLTSVPRLDTCIEKAAQLNLRACSDIEKEVAQAALTPAPTVAEVKQAEPAPEPTVAEVKQADSVPAATATDIKATTAFCLSVTTVKICDKATNKLITNAPTQTFDFLTTDADLTNQCQVAILGLSNDFVTCTSQQGDL